MKRFFTLTLGALAMIAVALISAFVAMRLAIHGREVEVPTLTGLTVADASAAARKQGLNLNLENRFYSTDVPAGHILGQSPAGGTRVRREWEVRVTESLGAQRVNIPDLTGQAERAATVSIRRLSLELGSVAHLPAPGEPDTVLTQTPPADTGGVDGPRVSLLVSDPESSAPPPAYVMPSLIGLSFNGAAARAATARLHLIVQQDAPPAAATGDTSGSSAAPNALPALTPSQADLLNLNPPPTPPRPTGNVVAQSPQPGHRVQRGDAVHVTLTHTAPTPE